MKQVLNLTYEKRTDRFKVASTKNTTEFLPGDVLKKDEVDGLVARAQKLKVLEVNLKGA